MAKQNEKTQNQGENLSEEFVDHVDQIIQTIEKNKDKVGIEPNHAMMMEIINAGRSQKYEPDDVMAALRRLARENRVRYGQTINSHYFKSKTQLK